MSITAAPAQQLTAEEFHTFASTRADERWELVGGYPVMAPTEAFGNLDAAAALLPLLAPTAPEWRARIGARVDLTPTADAPPTLRIPDVALIKADIDRATSVAPAAQVCLVVECVSPSSRTTDRLVKRDEYGAAGIPNYLIVDVTDAAAPRLTLYDRLVTTPEGTRYAEPPHTGESVTLRIDGHAITINAADLVFF